MKLVPSNNFSKKLHYILKYLVLALPMLLLLISCLIPKKNINNNYSVESDTQVNYKYQTNEVNTNDDLIVGNIYLVSDYSFTGQINCQRVIVYNVDSKGIYDFYISDGSINFYITDVFFVITFYINGLPTNSNSIRLLDYNISFVYNSSSVNNLSSYIVSCPNQYNIIDNTIITNTINENSSLISSNEGRTYNDEIISPIMTFYEMPLNNFYFDFLDTIGIVYTNEIVKYLLCYVLWIMYVYLFDLIADIFAFIPKILHNLAYKIGGED